jgi:hypothetical protein
MRDGARIRVDHHLNSATPDIGRSLRDAFIRNVHHVDRRCALEELAREMQAAANAARRIVELSRPGLRVGDEILYRLYGQRSRNKDDDRRASDQRHGSEILEEVVTELAV